MRKRFDTAGCTMRFTGETENELVQWQTSARAKLRELLGLHTMETCPLKPRVTEVVDCGDHVRERVELQTEPDVVMPVYVLIPKEYKGPAPAVVAPHGHGFGAKAGIAGVRVSKEVMDAIDVYQCDYGLRAVREGFLVFCPDTRGFGERREQAAMPDGMMGQSCQWINHMALALGQTAMGMYVWDLMRLLDYVDLRKDADTTHLACIGLSGGGYQTLLLAALDSRVRVAISSGYLYGAKESLLDMYTNCSCNYIPHMWEYFDQGDWAAMIAPRPLMIQTGDEDPLNGVNKLKNVNSQIAIARKAYRAAGAQRLPVHDVFHGEHRWDNANPWAFLRKHTASPQRVNLRLLTPVTRGDGPV